MNIDIKQTGNLWIIKPRDEKIDASVCESFKSKLLDLIGKDHRQILLDLEDVHFIDSAGLGVLITIGKQLQISKDGSFACCNVASAVRKVFDITHLSNFFPIYPDEATALSNIAQKELATSSPSSQDSMELFKNLRTAASKNGRFLDSFEFKKSLQTIIDESKDLQNPLMLVVIGSPEYEKIFQAGQEKGYLDASIPLFNELLKGDSLRGQLNQGRFVFLFKDMGLNELEKTIDRFLVGSDYKVILPVHNEEIYLLFSSVIITFIAADAVAETVLAYALDAFKSHLSVKSRKSVIA